MSMQIRSKKDLKEAVPPFLAFLGVFVIICAVMFLWGGNCRLPGAAKAGGLACGRCYSHACG